MSYSPTTLWKYDGVMGVYEDTGNPRYNRKVLDLGCGLGVDTEAIGRLAASAPELLQVLQELFYGSGATITFHDKYLSEKIAKAILKAEGELK